MNRESKRRYNGKNQTLGQWAEEYGMKYETLYQRLMGGYTMNEALTTPVRKRTHVMVDGQPVNVRQLAMKAGLPYLTVWKRIVKHGWDLDSALNTPVSKGNRHLFKDGVFNPPASEK